ncbi:MAG TPA: hypothetical protein VMW74_00045 [Nitrosopumilaceae archaeon]|nr:hypothetical protein [Nitrosopumilaceae archaeon]
MSQKIIQNNNHQVFWENFTSTTEGILDLFKEAKIEIDDLRITDPSKIKANNSLSISIFLFKISENPSIKNHTISVFSEPEKQYSFSENILHYILTVHSNEHMLGMNAIEKMLGVVYANPIISISNEIKKAHIGVNFNENPIEVWDKLFPSTPYRLSLLLDAHGAGVTYLNPKAKPRIDINYYDSTKEPELI